MKSAGKTLTPSGKILEIFECEKCGFRSDEAQTMKHEIEHETLVFGESAE